VSVQGAFGLSVRALLRLVGAIRLTLVGAIELTQVGARVGPVLRTGRVGAIDLTLVGASATRTCRVADACEHAEHTAEQEIGEAIPPRLFRVANGNPPRV
jgi:hypothetical protein